MTGIIDEHTYPCSGRGLCVIVANFYGNAQNSHHLPGYEADHKNLLNYFQNDLKYDVITEIGSRQLINLSQNEFKEAIKCLQTDLASRLKDQTKKIDNFVMFILSHGGQDGICMCEKGSAGKRSEVDTDGNTVFVSVEEIINSFTHDKIPDMGGIPKCFIIQACRGTGHIQVAGPGGDAENYGMEIPQTAMENPSIKRANILVAYATLDQTISYVHSKEGSWFIKTILDALRSNAQQKHLVEILTMVIKSLYEKGSTMQYFAVNHSDIDVLVEHGGRLYPLLIYGKLNKSESDSSGVPLEPGKTAYTHFAPSRQANQSLDQYRFDGNVTFTQAAGKKIELKSISAENLKAFADTKYFTIRGSLSHKVSGKSTNMGQVLVSGNRFVVEERKKIMNPGSLEIYGYLPDVDMKIDEKELQMKKAWLYINDDLYHIGQLQKYLGIWQVLAPIYQLPVLSSTLTKKMFLTPPVKSKDEIDGLMKAAQLLMAHHDQLKAGLGEEQPPPEDSKLPKDDTPRTTLGEVPYDDPETLPAAVQEREENDEAIETDQDDTVIECLIGTKITDTADND